jgi:hypothetical protein
MICRESGATVPYRLADVATVSRYNGHPRTALVTCSRCHRPGLRAVVCVTQIGVNDGEDGIATMPHHNIREKE